MDLNTLDPQIKKMVLELNELQSVLHGFASVSDVARMGTDLAIAASKVIDRWLVFLYVVWLKAAESHRTNCIFLYPGCIQSWVLFCFLC